MRSLHAQVAGLVVLLVGSTDVVHAQIKFGDMSAPAATKSIEFQPAKQLPGHGTLVAVELTNGDKVQGHVVRFNLAQNELFLRTKPGAAPVTMNGDNIKQVQVAWQAGPAGQKQMVVRPEIHTQVIYNGTYRTVAYSSTVLSPGERAVLAQLQKAENDCGALAHQKDQRETAIAQEMSMQAAQLKNQQLINDTLRNENYTNYPYPPATPSAAGILTLRANRGVVTSLPQVLPGTVGVVAMLPPPDPKAVAECQAELARVRGQAVLENGRLIAVVVK